MVAHRNSIAAASRSHRFAREWADKPMEEIAILKIILIN
jgi:hypothetical protein